MASTKFQRLAAKVGSTRLAGWITNHVPAVHARAEATRARHRRNRMANAAHTTSKSY